MEKGWVWPTKLWCSITINSTTVICSAFYGNVAPAPFVDEMVDDHAANFQHLVVVPTTTSICCSKHNCVCKKGMQKTISHSSCLKIHWMIHNILNSQWFFHHQKSNAKVRRHHQDSTRCSLVRSEVCRFLYVFNYSVFAFCWWEFSWVYPTSGGLSKGWGSKWTCKNSMK